MTSSAMHQVKIAQEDDWNISGSEDEVDLQQKFKNSTKFETDMKKKKKKISNGNANLIPRKVALLYKDIEKNGWIELQCKCPRKGSAKSDSQSQDSSFSQSSTSSVSNRLENAHIAKDNRQQIIRPKNRIESHGFDYIEDEERPYIPKASSLKKTPVSAKRAKKVASMANVVNDLFRQKMLDEMESGAFEKECKKILSEEKDSRVKLDFDTQDSMPEITDSLASQISHVETLLDSKDAKSQKDRRNEKERLKPH